MKILKKMVFFFFISGSLPGSYAQGSGGFFNQQSSKEKLMLAQIAGYETYLKELKNGYTATAKGLNTAHELKNGTFTLHQNYDNALKQVSPAVAADPKVKGITDLIAQIGQTFSQAISWQQDKGGLTAAEISYMQSVYLNLLRECDKAAGQLKLAVTPGAVQMTDQQRIRSIDLVYADIQQKYRFARAFIAQAYELAKGRLSDQTANQTLKQLYDLN